MNKKYIKWVAAAILLGVATMLFAQPGSWGRRVISNTLQWDGVYQSTGNANLTAPYPGQLSLDYGDATTAPSLEVYDHVGDEWDIIPNDDSTVTWTAAQTYSAANTLNGAVTLGSDNEDAITVNGSFIQDTFRQEFDYVSYKALENDDTAAVTTDASVNYLELYGPGQIRLIGYRIEAPGGPGLAATPAPGATHGVFTVDGYVDDADNEGIQFTFGAMDNATTGAFLAPGIAYDETLSENTYCEVQVDIGNISAVDDFWFGWALTDATDNPPASADFDTAALITLLDATGDWYANVSLNDAAEVVDDLAVDAVDGDQVILRVEMLADSVVFSGCLTDACSTVADFTTATAVMDADDGDEFKCVLGFTNVAAESLGLTINYVEIGVAN